MPKVKNFPFQTRSTGDDTVPVLAGGLTESQMQLRNFFGIRRASATADLTRTEASNVVDPALTISLAANVPVMIEYRITWQVGVSATGLSFTFSGPWSSPWTDGYRYRTSRQTAINTHIVDYGGGVFGSPEVTWAFPAALHNNGWNTLDLEVVYNPPTAGDVEFKWGTCTSVTRIGASWIRVTPL